MGIGTIGTNDLQSYMLVNFINHYCKEVSESDQAIHDWCIILLNSGNIKSALNAIDLADKISNESQKTSILTSIFTKLMYQQQIEGTIQAASKIPCSYLRAAYLSSISEKQLEKGDIKSAIQAANYLSEAFERKIVFHNIFRSLTQTGNIYGAYIFAQQIPNEDERQYILAYIDKEALKIENIQAAILAVSQIPNYDDRNTALIDISNRLMKTEYCYIDIIVSFASQLADVNDRRIVLSYAFSKLAEEIGSEVAFRQANEVIPDNSDKDFVLFSMLEQLKQEIGINKTVQLVKQIVSKDIIDSVLKNLAYVLTVS